jgi:hypothetical protein
VHEDGLLLLRARHLQPGGEVSRPAPQVRVQRFEQLGCGVQRRAGDTGRRTRGRVLMYAGEAPADGRQRVGQRRACRQGPIQRLPWHPRLHQEPPATRMPCRLGSQPAEQLPCRFQTSPGALQIPSPIGPEDVPLTIARTCSVASGERPDPASERLVRQRLHSVRGVSWWCPASTEEVALCSTVPAARVALNTCQGASKVT